MAVAGPMRHMPEDWWPDRVYLRAENGPCGDDMLSVSSAMTGKDARDPSFTREQLQYMRFMMWQALERRRLNRSTQK